MIVRMRHTLLAAALVLLGGCPAHHQRAKPVMGPDGTTHFAVRCGKQTTCYERAAAACPGGYVIVDKGATYHQTTYVQPSFQLGVPGTPAGSTGGTTTTMLIRCQAPTAAR
jgi:hypothetical protein